MCASAGKAHGSCPGVVVHDVPLKRGRLAVETARAAHEHGGTVLFGLCDEDMGLPSFVVNEFRKFLRCGVLAHGFARIRCGDGVFERLLPFSCKGR